jgi:photosystem II stability/assembly factor-like uncharacterized protein
MRLARSAVMGTMLITLIVTSACSTNQEQHVSSAAHPANAATADSHAGVAGSHGWRISSGQLQISSDGGTAWSNDTLPTGLSADAVMAGQVSSSGGLVLADIVSTGVSVFCQSTPNGAWQASDVTPEWVPGYNVSGAPRQVSLDFDSNGDTRLVLQTPLGAATALVSSFESPSGACSFAPIFSASSLRWDSEVFASQQNGLVLVGPANKSLEFTTDGGKTWTTSSLPSGATGGTLSSPVWNGTGFVVLDSHPDSSAVDISVLTSADGDSFSLSGQPLSVPESQDPGTFTVLASGSNIWTFGSSHEVFESNNLGDTWQTVQDSSVPLGVVNGAMSSGTSAFVVAQSSTCTPQSCSTTTSTWATGDGGTTWVSQ